MRKPIIRLCIICILIVLSSSPLLEVAQTNILGVRTSRFILSLDKLDNHSQITQDNCRAQWLKGVISNSSGDFDRRDESWVSAAKCDPGYIVLMHRLVPWDQSLAAQVRDAVPASAEAWFWLGDLVPQESIENYGRGLELDPMDARRWLSFAGMIEPIDPQTGLKAMIRACELGDPGFNACLGAAHRFLALGDTPSAIRILRQSTWQGALDFADRLEVELNEGK